MPLIVTHTDNGDRASRGCLPAPVTSMKTELVCPKSRRFPGAALPSVEHCNGVQQEHGLHLPSPEDAQGHTAAEVILLKISSLGAFLPGSCPLPKLDTGHPLRRSPSSPRATSLPHGSCWNSWKLSTALIPEAGGASGPPLGPGCNPDQLSPRGFKSSGQQAGSGSDTCLSSSECRPGPPLHSSVGSTATQQGSGPSSC